MQRLNHKVDKLVHLIISGEEIITTVDHPFYVQGRGFIEAGNLLVGDKLVSANSEDLVIEKFYIEETENPVDVYNFQVEDYHTYHVGKNGVLVHNANYPKDPDLIQELKDNNIKFNENKIMRMTRDADGKVVWLEEGNSNAGYQHILEEHAGDFANKGSSPEQMDAVTNGEIIGTQGRPPGRPIYSFEYNGETREIVVTILEWFYSK